MYSGGTRVSRRGVFERIGEHAPPADGGGEHMQFLQAVNWLRASLSRLAEVVDPLRVQLEEHMGEFNAGPNESHQIG